MNFINVCEIFEYMSLILESLTGATTNGTVGMVRGYQVHANGRDFAGNLSAPALQKATMSNQTLDKDSGMLAIVRAMQKPGSGLEVRERVWLNVPIPKAFLGSDMVDWLLEKVGGFQVKKILLYFNNLDKYMCI